MKHLLLWLLLLPGALYAQPAAPAPTQPSRLEVPLPPEGTNISVLPLADSTVALLMELNANSYTRRVYELRHYDQHLQLQLQKSLPAPRNYQLVAYCGELPYAYALFQSDFVPSQLSLVRLNLRDGGLLEYAFDTKTTGTIHNLEALGGNLFAIVEVTSHLTVLHLDVAAEEYHLVTSVYEPLPAQVNFLVDTATQRLGVVLSQSNGYRSRLQVKQLSAQGNLLASQFVQAESEKGLITAELSPGDSTARLLTGTYTLRDPRFSQGLFAAGLQGQERTTLRFYDFQNLKHFFDFMKPARARRLRARGARLKAAGREMRLHYRLLTHRLMPFQGGYVLVAEVYYPHYRYDASGMLAYARRSFEGYHSTQAIVCGFDSTGMLLWDNNFVLHNAEVAHLGETVRFRPLPDGQRLALAYLDENNIRYKIVDRTEDSPNDLKTPLLTNTQGKKEKIISTTEQDMQPWYGSRFLAYGRQRVRPERGSAREVFFLNTVSFD